MIVYFNFGIFNFPSDKFKGEFTQPGETFPILISLTLILIKKKPHPRMLHCFDLFSSKIGGGGKPLMTFCFDTGVGGSQIVKIFHWFLCFRPF